MDTTIYLGTKKIQHKKNKQLLNVVKEERDRLLGKLNNTNTDNNNAEGGNIEKDNNVINSNNANLVDTKQLISIIESPQKTIESLVNKL
ncbi:MAG: hypothetical protein ACTTJH_08395 [Bacteroidales bacterium]